MGMKVGVETTDVDTKSCGVIGVGLRLQPVTINVNNSRDIFCMCPIILLFRNNSYDGVVL